MTTEDLFQLDPTPIPELQRLRANLEAIDERIAKAEAFAPGRVPHHLYADREVAMSDLRNEELKQSGK